jgi:hypothetical protein
MEIEVCHPTFHEGSDRNGGPCCELSRKGFKIPEDLPLSKAPPGGSELDDTRSAFLLKL